MYGIVIEEKTGLDADAVARRLQEAGIDTRPFFVGLHAQPALLRRGLFEAEAFPVADRLARQGLYLPSGLALTEAELSEVCDAVADIFV